MLSETELDRVKLSLSPQLMQIDGVSGVGVGEGYVQIYLADDTHSLRTEVEAVVSQRAPHAPVRYVISGRFSSL